MKLKSKQELDDVLSNVDGVVINGNHENIYNLITFVVESNGTNTAVLLVLYDRNNEETHQTIVSTMIYDFEHLGDKSFNLIARGNINSIEFIQFNTINERIQNDKH